MDGIPVVVGPPEDPMPDAPERIPTGCLRQLDVRLADSDHNACALLPLIGHARAHTYTNLTLSAYLKSTNSNINPILCFEII